MKALVFPFLLGFSMLLQGQTLLESSFLERKTKEQINAVFQGFIPAQNEASYYRILYTTRDLEGRTDTASGLIIVPELEESALPIFVDQHGTAFSKQAVPSNGSYGLGEMPAGQGYIVLAPDMLGLGASRGFHPFVHSASEAWAAIDMLYAARDFLSSLGLEHNGQLFLGGYSQGGHASAALHRALEATHADEFPVTAAAHMAGPYSISGEMADVMSSENEYGFVSFVAYTFLSYNLVYELYDSNEAVFKQPYAAYVDSFSNWSIDLGRLEELMTRELIATRGKKVPSYMLQDSIVEILRKKDPTHQVIQALRDNDLLEWVPRAPTIFIHCSGDQIIPFRNSVLADSTMNELGAESVDLFNPSQFGDHGTCILPALLKLKEFLEQHDDIQTHVLASDLPEVEVFPNPALSTLHLRHLPPGTRAELFRSDGTLAKRGILSGSSVEWDVSDLSAGIYLLRLRSGQGTLVRKIVVGR